MDFIQRQLTNNWTELIDFYSALINEQLDNYSKLLIEELLIIQN